MEYEFASSVEICVGISCLNILQVHFVCVYVRARECMRTFV